MTITIADLLLILPVLVLTGTAVLSMSAIAVDRNYPVTAFITVAGLFLAAVCAVMLMPDANQQVTPLLIIDPYSLFFSAVVCLSAMFKFTNFSCFFNASISLSVKLSHW